MSCCTTLIVVIVFLVSFIIWMSSVSPKFLQSFKDEWNKLYNVESYLNYHNSGHFGDKRDILSSNSYPAHSTKDENTSNMYQSTQIYKVHPNSYQEPNHPLSSVECINKHGLKHCTILSPGERGMDGVTAMANSSWDKKEFINLAKAKRDSYNIRQISNSRNGHYGEVYGGFAN
jgi:hypothetical protein